MLLNQCLLFLRLFAITNNFFSVCSRFFSCFLLLSTFAYNVKLNSPLQKYTKCLSWTKRNKQQMHGRMKERLNDNSQQKCMRTERQRKKDTKLFWNNKWHVLAFVSHHALWQSVTMTIHKFNHVDVARFFPSLLGVFLFYFVAGRKKVREIVCVCVFCARAPV